MGWGAGNAQGDETEGIEMHKHGKKDTTQDGIVAALREIGAHVQSLASVGDGVPDLLVSYRGAWFVFEVKSPGGKLTECEKKWHDAARASVFIVYSADDALKIVMRETRV